jgi:hypothetical protein
MYKAIGGSDVCHTCAAHTKVIMEDLEPKIAAYELALRRIADNDGRETGEVWQLQYLAQAALDSQASGGTEHG